MSSPKSALRVVLCAFVACVWLNQSVGGKDWEDLRDRVFAAPRENLLELARYPFVFLYRRSLDERYYFEIASAILGQPADVEIVRHMHGNMPASFRQDLPPADGRWHAPYAEVPLEYPPINVPAIVLPRMLASTFKGYGFVFGGLMGLCLLGAVALAIDTARRAGGGDPAPSRWLLASGLLLAQGALAVQRLDPIAALFLALAVRAAVRRRPLELGVMAGLAGAAKITPLLLLPAIVAADPWLFRSPRNLARVTAGAATSFLLSFAPVLVTAKEAALEMLRYHAARGLNVESTFGVLYGLGRALLGHAEIAPASFGSQNFVGTVPDLLAQLTFPLTLVLLAWLTFRIGAAARTETSDTERAGRQTAAALAAAGIVWLAGKVLSPQYLTWGIPLVLAIPGRTGTRLAWGAVAAMALTQLYFRGYYDMVVEQRAAGLVTLAVRQAVLVAVVVVAGGRAVRPHALSPGATGCAI